MRFSPKASQQEERDAARDLHRKCAFRNGNRDQGRNSPDGLDRPKCASSPCQLRNRRISQKADDACAKDHRLGAHNPFGADKQADPAIEEKLTSQESECEQRQRGKRLEGLSIDREHGAPCCANDWTCNRFYQCLCAAPVKSCKRPAFAARGQGGGPVCVEAVGRGLIGFLYCSTASLTRFASFFKSVASGWDRALSKFSIMASMLGMWSGCSFIFT